MCYEGWEDRITRIAIVFEYATLNGGERSMLTVIDRIDRAEFHLAAIAPESGPLADALRERGIALLPLRLWNERGARLPRDEAAGNLLSAICDLSPDVVHANSLAMGRLTGAIAGKIRVPAVAHLRDILKLSRAAVADLNRNRLLIAVSQATRDFHVDQGIDAARTRVLYNGVDCRRFCPRDSTGRLKRELGVSDGAFLVVTIGQIGLRKGQDVLAEAAVVAARRLPNVHYLLLGQRHSAKRESVEFERNVVHRFDEAGLGDRLHRLGYRNDVAWIMNEADLLVHPAHQEPLGRVLLEAAAAGLPIVATQVGGTPEIVEDGASARLVPPGDPEALAEAIVELRFDAAQRRRLAAQARVRAESTFDANRAAADLSEVWTEVARRDAQSR